MSRSRSFRPSIASRILDVCSIRCGACAHTGPTEQFSRDGEGQPLALTDYRCPACGAHIRLIATVDEFNAPAVRVENLSNNGPQGGSAT